MNKKIRLLLIIVLLFVLLFCYLMYQNNILQVTNYSVSNNKITKEFKNFKIIQVSDFHNTDSKILTNKLIKEIKKEKPNIIVLTGDLIDSRKLNIDISINFVKSIKEIAPIYYVSGNHEASITNYNELKERLIENDVIILDNKVEVLEINNKQINLIGIDDPQMSFNPSMNDVEIVDYYLDNLIYDNSLFTVILSHRPELFDFYVNNEIDLVLAGHAHGGQFRLPFIGGVYAPHQGMFPQYDSGVFTSQNTTMIVSRGIGNSVIPFRINNRPQLVVIELK